MFLIKTTVQFALAIIQNFSIIPVNILHTTFTNKKRLTAPSAVSPYWQMAEWEGFEPSQPCDSNDLAKMPKLQFVVLTLNLSLYIVVAHCKIILKMF